MRTRSAAACALALALQLTLAAPCNAIEMPRFLKGLTTPRDSNVAPPRPSQEVEIPGGGPPAESSGRRNTGRESASRRSDGSTDNDVRIQEIRKDSGKAAVVFDRHCPRLVQPYRLTDNFASVGMFAVGESIKNFPNPFSARSRPRKEPDISASAKLAAKQMNWLPMSAEVLYGERSHNAETNILDRDGKLGMKFYPVADKMLKDVLSKINEQHEYKFKVFILKNSSRNAMARPGGFVYIDQGLIDDTAQHPKAYFALAHEIAHVLQRHETKELQSMIVDSIQTQQDLMKVMSNVRGDPTVILGHVKVQKNLFTQHHIDQELQSDSCAARLLSRVFPDKAQLGNALQAFLKDLPKVSGSQPARQPQNDVEKLAATAHSIVKDPIKRHPTTQQRYDNLRTIYNEIVSGTWSKLR